MILPSGVTQTDSTVRESSQTSRATSPNGSGALSGAGAGGVVSWGAGDGPFAGAPSRATASARSGGFGGGAGPRLGIRAMAAIVAARTTAPAAIQTGRRPLSRPAVARGDGCATRPRSPSERLIAARAAAGSGLGSDRAMAADADDSSPSRASFTSAEVERHASSRAATSAIDAGRSSGRLAIIDW